MFQLLNDLAAHWRSMFPEANPGEFRIVPEKCPENMDGELTVNAFRYARLFKTAPDKLAELSEEFLSGHADVEKVSRVKAFVNVTLNPSALFRDTLADVAGLLGKGEVRIPSGCAISGVFHKDGRRENGSGIVAGIAAMHERSNGLGGGFAGYGIYPEYRELYAFHVFYDTVDAQHAAEARLLQDFDVESSGTLPTRPIAAIRDAPSLMRYFAAPKPQTLLDSKLDEREFVVRFVTRVNREIGGAYVFSCGKNMGVFKAVGYPEDVGEFYRLEEYEGYAWTAHGRYPTNTPGWWGGAHPFSILDYSVVHNGEISSYDANRRFIEMYGYNCSLLTDTEVITYIIDFLVRRKGLTLEEAAGVIAAPFWSTIEQMPEAQRERLAYLRETFASLLITGPFSILLGFTGGMMALNDRLKLRSMVCAEKGEAVYFASEECAIRVMEPDVETLWAPRGGQAVVVRLNDGVTV